MADAPRVLIMQNIETAFEAIQKSNNYRTNVCKVERVLRAPGDVRSAERPWIGFMPMIQLTEFQPFECMRMTLPVVVMAYVQSKDEDERARLVGNLEDDMIGAIMSDITRGGNATSTIITSIQTDEGDVTGHGIIKMDLQIVYFRTTGVS